MHKNAFSKFFRNKLNQAGSKESCRSQKSPQDDDGPAQRLTSRCSRSGSGAGPVRRLSSGQCGPGAGTSRCRATCASRPELRRPRSAEKSTWGGRAGPGAAGPPPSGRAGRGRRARTAPARRGRARRGPGRAGGRAAPDSRAAPCPSARRPGPRPARSRTARRSRAASCSAHRLHCTRWVNVD